MRIRIGRTFSLGGAASFRADSLGIDVLPHPPLEDEEAPDGIGVVPCSALVLREVNSSMYVFNARDLLWALDRLDADNDQGELYLTDTIGHLVRDGWDCVNHSAN